MAVNIFERESIDVLVTDLSMPQIDGLGLLAISRKLDATRPVIVMTAYGAIDTAIESIRNGHRQRARRKGHSCPGSPSRRVFHLRELRGATGESARKRAFRTRQGSLHGGHD